MMHAGHAGHLWADWGGDASSVAGLAAMTFIYAAGARQVWARAGSGHGVRRRDVACFVGALLVLALALLSPIDALSASLFSAHMTQHVLLAVAAPPLLASSGMLFSAMWALPEGARRAAVAALRAPAVARVWRAITEPFTACAVHAATVWAWHAPALYVAALRNPLVHVAEHATFVATAALLWWSILRPRRTRRAAFGVGILALFLTTLQTGALGALLTFSQQIWFPLQESGAAAAGLTPLEDQQLAGLIMWVPGGLLYVIAMAALFAAWMRELGRSAAQRDAVLSPSSSSVAAASRLLGT